MTVFIYYGKVAEDGLLALMHILWGLIHIQSVLGMRCSEHARPCVVRKQSKPRTGTTHPLSSESSGPAELCGRACILLPRSRSYSCSLVFCCRYTDIGKGSATWKRRRNIPSMNMNPSGTGPSTLSTHTPTHTCARTPPSSCPSGRCAGSCTPLGRRCACRRSTPEHNDTADESRRENLRLL